MPSHTPSERAKNRANPGRLSERDRLLLAQQLQVGALRPELAGGLQPGGAAIGALQGGLQGGAIPAVPQQPVTSPFAQGLSSTGFNQNINNLANTGQPVSPDIEQVSQEDEGFNRFGFNPSLFKRNLGSLFTTGRVTRR